MPEVDECHLAGWHGTLRLSPDAFEVTSGQNVVVRIPIAALCGAMPSPHALDHFLLIYHETDTNHTVDVRCATALAAKAWVDRIQAALNLQRGFTNPHILLLVNPAAGRGRSVAVARTAVVPVLEAGGATVEVRCTERPGHAEALCRSLRVRDYDVIAVLGGDGSLHDVINGLLDRSDAAEVSKIVRLAVVPCGSGNALAASLGLRTVDAAVWGICQGNTRALDIAACWHRGRRQFLFINMLFSILCDVDFFSETMRWLGEARFTVQGVWEIIRFRSRAYQARLELLAADTFVQEECREGPCPRCSPPAPLQVPTTFKSDTEPGFSWRLLEDTFPFFACQNSKLVSRSTKTCPYAHLADGTLDVCLLRGESRPSRLDLVRVLLSMDGGDHLRALPKLEYYKVKALRFTPLWEGGQLGIDGERQPFGPLDIRMCGGSIVVVGPPARCPPVTGLSPPRRTSPTLLAIAAASLAVVAAIWYSMG